MVHRLHIVDAKDNSNIRTEDVEVAEGEDPSTKIELAEGEAIGHIAELSANQSKDQEL